MVSESNSPISSERELLHSLSTPLSVAYTIAATFKRNSLSPNSHPPLSLEQGNLQRLIESLEKIVSLVKKRQIEILESPDQKDS